MRYLLPALLFFVSACSDPVPEISPDNQKRLAAGAQLEKELNVPAAIVTYQDIIARGNAPTEAYLKLAEAYKKINRPADALKTLQEARALKPNDIRILNPLGLALIAAGQPKDAVGIFDELIAVEPDNAMHYNGKAIAFDNAGNHVAAQEIYQKALSIDGSPKIKNNLALSYVLSGKFNEAIALLEPMANDASASPTVIKNLALAYELIGDTARAAEIRSKDSKQQQTPETMRLYEEYRKTARKNAGKTN